MLVTEGHKDVDTKTGEVIFDAERWGVKLEDRNIRPSVSEAKRALRQSIFGGRSPQAKSLPADYHGADPYWCPHTGDIWTCEGRCNRGVERADGKRVPMATDAQRRAARMAGEIDWYFSGAIVRMGRDADGRDYSQDLKTGKVERAYSQNAKREALELVTEYGLSAASRKTGIPRTTLNNWKARGIA